MDKWKHEFIQTNGIRMHYVTAGSGPLVVLLHGFPEFWYAWRRQIPEIAKHFKVVVPDLRGYGQTDRPLSIADYRMSLLTADIEGLIKGLGYANAHIVGHDWGGAIAWKMALDHPEVVGRLVVLNCPHPVMFARAMKSNYKQMLRSWYILFFQTPYLPELSFKLFPKQIVNMLFRKSVIRKDTFSDADIATYRQALEKPGAFRAMINYYRAAFRKDQKKERSRREIIAPTLLIWGEEDTALGKEMTKGMEPLFDGEFKLHYIPHCGHWVNEEQPAEVNRLIIDHLTH